MNKRMNLITERENPENREVNKKIKDILTGDSRRYTDIKKMGYDVNIDDSARKEFGKRYFGKNIEITNPKTGRKLYANVGKDYTPDTIIAKGDEERNSKWHKLSGHSGALHKGNKDKFDYKNFLDSPTPEREDNKLTTVQQYRKDKQFLKDMEYDAKRIDDARNRISNIRSKYNLKPQTESLSEVEEKAREAQNPVYADAIRGIKRADKAREEYRKLPKAEVREEKPKFKGTQNMKKMYLSESLFEEVTRGDNYSYEGDYIVQVYSYSDNNYDTRIEQCLDNNEAAGWFDELNQMTDKELNENGLDGFAWLTVDDEGNVFIVDKRISGFADTAGVQKEIDYFVNTKQKNESLNEGFYRGVPGVELIYHGDWSDPELSFTDENGKTYIANYYTIEDGIYQYYKELGAEQKAQGLNSEFKFDDSDEDFDRFVQSHADMVKSDIIDFGREVTDEACKSKQKQTKKQLKEDSEIHVFDQIPDEEIYDQADYVFSDDGLYGRDYTDGLIIGGNRDYSSIIYSKEHKDEIKDLLYSGYSSDEIVQELNKITGKTYVADQISGYSQSDWNNIYYPTGEFSNDSIREIEDAYFGKYTAYDDGNELVVVFDSDRRPVKEIISDQTGIPVNQIKIRKFTGYTRTPNYEDDED